MKIKIGSERLVYIVIIVIIGAFVLNMKQIYNFMDKLKRGEFFKKTHVATKSDDVVVPVEDSYEIVTPTGDILYICNLKESDSTSNEKNVTVSLYGYDGILSGIKQVTAYDSSSADSANYLYSESSKYNELKNSNKSIKGFSVEYKMSGTTSLSTTVAIDLTKTSVDNITSTHSSILYLKGKLNDTVEDLVKEYKEGGFTCGQQSN